MKIILEPYNKNNLYLDYVDGLILPLKDFSVDNNIYYDINEIEELSKLDKEIFISINKNIFNEDIDKLIDILKRIDKLNVKGIFFYDISLVEIKNKLNLKTNLVLSQTHMVNNYNIINYYFDNNVKYALISKEINIKEILEIINNIKSYAMVEILSKPRIAFSKRKLLTNYYKDINKDISNKLIVEERLSKTNYIFKEDINGTSIYLDDVLNGTSVIKDLYENNLDYIVLRDDDIINFNNIIKDIKKYIDGKCLNDDIISKYKDIGTTGFFYKDSIYKVKKNEKD